MNGHIEISFDKLQEEQPAILVALLSENGFDGFLETSDSLKAYIGASDFKEEELIAICEGLGITFSVAFIGAENWNAKWESDFDPVIVDDFVSIRASFHAPVKGVEHEILITPKMSFGTGHHATTRMMVELMREIDFLDKRVFDFGAGTGVLAILAKKLGASIVLAIDNDPWSVENANENIRANNCQSITMRLADRPPENESFNIILANINKSILLRFLAPLQKLLKPGGQLLLSGLLIEDEADIQEAAAHLSLQLSAQRSTQGWLALKFTS